MLNFRDYIGYAERYVGLAEQEWDIKESSDIDWLLIPAVILSWTAIESFVNNRLDDYGSLPNDMFELHERALLIEKRVRFIDSGDKAGTFTLEGTEYRNLEEKILFLIAKFSSKKGKNIKQNLLWQEFQDFKRVRDCIMHPRHSKEVALGIETVTKYIETAKNVIQLLSEHLWRKKISF